MRRIAAIVLSALICFTSGCAHQSASPQYIRHVDLKVTRYGETAVVTGVENLKGTYKGRPGEMALRFTNTLVRRDGRWQLVAHQSTRVASSR
jgi:ketosteroid isomerase-like protein